MKQNQDHDPYGIGERIRARREELGLTGEDVARVVRHYGCNFSRPFLSLVEKGEATLNVLQVIGVLRALDLTFDELTGPVKPIDNEQDTFDEVDYVTARKLGVSTKEFRSLSLKMWGRSFAVERDSRVSSTKASRSLQAKRGHVSRKMVSEMLDYEPRMLDYGGLTK